MLLFLIGLPGSGKTWWSQRLATTFGCRSIDLDNEIERQSGKTIPELFAVSAHHFRHQEQATLRALILQYKESDIIVATGGGTPCFLDNLQAMKKSGFVIYLKRNIDTLITSIRRFPVQRPLLPAAPEKLRASLERMKTERSAFYEQADVVVDADGLTDADWKRIIEPLLNQNLHHDV